MNTQEFKRKLTAVFSADVAGYSRLMGEDEAATVKTLEAYKQIMFSLIKQHRGRVIDSPGDNLLAEFASVVDAVQCAVAVQKELQARNVDLPENRRMQFRIGINLGDVIEEQDRIYGDGVNIAARLESCADPGGICVSKTAFDHIETKLPLGYEYLGEKEVKNIAKPVGAYRVLMDPRVTVAGAKEKKPPIPLWRKKSALAGAVAVLIVVIGAVVWNFYLRPPPIEPASKEKMAFPLPDKPSIAVLPFTNMSEDPKQEYFSDGLTEEIITALSKVPKLFVIARNSTFSYKGKSPKVKQVAEELGVRYVLEGSVRKAGEQVRITTQLIDALSGHHLWAERYDGDLKDIFVLQDAIAKKILTAIQVKITDGEYARIAAKGTENLQAYLKVLHAREWFYSITKEGFAEARRLSEEAIALDPKYAAAYVYLGSTHLMDVALGTSKSPQESLKLAFESITKAKALDDSYSIASSLLGFLYLMKREHDKGIAECERAIDLEPNSGAAHMWMSLALTFAGNHQEAIRHAEQALRFDPFPVGWWFRALGQAYFGVGRYEEAIPPLQRALQGAPDDILTHLYLTTTYSWAGRLEEARNQAAQVIRINSNFSLEELAKRSLYRTQADRQRYLDGLRKAGLPEKPPLPLPDKPSIAVLPFVNMSEDKSKEYFSDGLTEEIINALVKLPQVFVIARNSSFTYKGKSVDVRQVGREMGVKYVLEGSVRREGERIRVTAQLVDATTGNHLFSERYDREGKDLFALQDDITMKVMTAMRVQLTEGDYARAFAKGTKNLEAYLKAMQSYQQRQVMTKEGQARARQLAEEAIALDPRYAMAYCHLAAALGNEAVMGVYKNVPEVLARSVELAQKAVALDDSLAQAHITLGFQYTLRRDFDRAIAEGERAVALEPNSAEIVAGLAAMLEWADRPEEAMPLFKKAMRLSPVPQTMWLLNMASAHVRMGQYEESIPICKTVLQKQPDQEFAHIFLAIAYISTGREQEARAEAAEILRVNPKFSWERLARSLPRKNQDEMKRRGELLRKAGLSE